MIKALLQKNTESGRKDMLTDFFGEYHPIIVFLYFLIMLGITMFVNHPVILLCSFLGAMSYSAVLKGKDKAAKQLLTVCLPGLIAVTLVNAAFNHYGVTILFYLHSGNAVTLESIMYGLVLGGVLFISIQWFQCLNEVMTSDRLVYLFGKLTPALSLILSMVFRFVPRFNRQLHTIQNGQKCFGRNMEGESVFQKIRQGIKEFSILVTWSLENALDTADSMKARGYGLPGRSSFSIFRFRKKDWILAGLMLFLGGWILWGGSHGCFWATYNPKMEIGGLKAGMAGIFSWLAAGVFSLLPVLVDSVENARWERESGSVENDKKLTVHEIYKRYGDL